MRSEREDGAGETYSLTAGCLYWCDTARSNIGTRFSVKSFRPVLLVQKIESYGAVYPCSSLPAQGEQGDYVGDLFQTCDTFVILSSGLYYAPLSDMTLPGRKWPDWTSWSRQHRTIIKTHLEQFRASSHSPISRNRSSITSSADRSDSFKLGDLLPQELKTKLSALNSEKVNPASPVRQKPVPRLSPEEEFRRAVDAIAPYQILKEEFQEEELDGNRKKRDSR